MDLICTLNKDFYIPTEYYQTVNNTRMTIHWRKHLVSLKLWILHEQSIKIILDLFIIYLLFWYEPRVLVLVDRWVWSVTRV